MMLRGVHELPDQILDIVFKLISELNTSYNEDTADKNNYVNLK